MNNYIVIEDLNVGTFGQVKKIKNKYTNKIYAVKIEDINIGLLEYEAKIYNLLTDITSVPSIKSYKNDGKNRFLIMDLMDYNLKYFKHMNYYNNSKYQVLCKNIIVSLIRGLKLIHGQNIIHRDIKPDNICFHNNVIKIIDFGLSKMIYDNEIKCKGITEIIGTPNYVSKNVINLNEPTKIDDLESLCYIFLYLILDDETFKKYTECNIVTIKDLNYIQKYLNSRKDCFVIISQHLKLCRSELYKTCNIYDALINIYI
tara:strand:- start:157 stop:930 length:774 start_codon:yes stop_codon:yes gene_type:complete